MDQPLPDTIINLLNYSYSMAKALLEEHGELYPIGVCIDQEGKTMQRLSKDDTEDLPLASILVDQIQNDFTNRLSAGTITAYSIVYEATVTNQQYSEPTNVLIAKFSCTDTDTEGSCFLPYKITDKAVEFLEPWLE